LKHILGPGERVEADQGYRGEPLYISVPSDCTSERHKLAKAKARARHETINRRFKHWQCLKQVFRHDRSKQSAVFRAVAVLTQLSMEHYDPAWQVKYYDDGV
jgi:hypothetical protein